MRLILLLSIFLFSMVATAQPIEYAQKISINSKVYEKERTLRIALPASYDSNAELSYPVIYVVRSQYDMLSVVASLDMLGAEVPEFIVVGIDGSNDEFFPSRDGSQTGFSCFLHDEVTPYIEQNYRTAPYTIVTGHSAASVFVLEDWLDNGKSFSKYIAISPPLKRGQLNKRVKGISVEKLKVKSPLFITIANEGETADKMFADLDAMLSGNSLATFKAFPEQTHMSTRVNSLMAGLREAFQNWKPSKEVEEGSLNGLVKYYDDLSKRYGYEVIAPLDMLARMSGFGSWSDDVEKNKNAAAAVKYVIDRNPKDADELFDTAEQLLGFKAIEGNKRLISYICNELPKDKRCLLD